MKYFLFILLFLSCQTIMAIDNWKTQYSETTNALRAVFFSDLYTGWIVGEEGGILATNNGGENWANQASGVSQQLNDVFFVGHSRGWAVGNGSTMLHTSDGGQKWTRQSWTGPLEGLSSDFTAVYFVNDTTGYVVGSQNTILKTSNAGETWSDVASSVYPNANSLVFVNEQTGWVCGGLGNGTLLKTSNGGSSWSVSYPVSLPLFDIAYVDENTVFAVGGDAITGVLVKSTDGGTTWSDTSFNDIKAIRSISIVENSIFCSGMNGKIMVSTDTGHTWSVHETNTSENLLAIHQLNKRKVWSVGNNGTVLYKEPKVEICLVTIDDESQRNMVIWEKYANQGIAYYNVYKLEGGDYIYLDSVSFTDVGYYIDYSSTPSVHSDKYKISVIDSAGVESTRSPYHETINLQVSQGVPASTYNLAWNYYLDESEEFVPDYYYIYKGTSRTNLNLYDSVSGTLAPSYNDVNVFDEYYYMISVAKENACDEQSFFKASLGPFSQSISNIEDNRLREELEVLYAENVAVFPNPFTDHIMLQTDLIYPQLW